VVDSVEGTAARFYEVRKSKRESRSCCGGFREEVSGYISGLSALHTSVRDAIIQAYTFRHSGGA
jgi:hypothetical protein